MEATTEVVDPGPPPPKVAHDPAWCREGWCWIEPQPHGADLRAVRAFAEDDVWAVGQSGLITHWDGQSWSPVELAFDEPIELYSIWATGPDAIVVGADRSRLLRFDGPALLADPNAFELWDKRRAGPAPNDPVVSLWGPNADTLYALIGDTLRELAGVYVHDGSAWEYVADQPLIKAQSLAGLDSDSLLVFGTEGRIATYTEGAWSTTTLRTPGKGWTFEAVSMGQGELAIGARDWVYLREGAAWKRLRSKAPLGQTILALTRRDDGELWGASGWGLIRYLEGHWRVWDLDPMRLRAIDHAGEWVFAVGDRGASIAHRRGAERPSLGPRGPARAWGLTGFANEVWVADNRGVWHFDGQTGTRTGALAPTALSASGPGTLHSINASGYELYVDGERARRDFADVIGCPKDSEPSAVWAADLDEVWLVCGHHAFHRHGQTWSRVETEVSIDALAGGEAGHVLLSGIRDDQRVVLRYDGETLSEEPTEDLPTERLALAAWGDRGGALVTRSGLVFVRDAKGWTERPALVNEALPGNARLQAYRYQDLWAFAPNQVWVLGDHRTHYSAKPETRIMVYEGETWRELDLPNIEVKDIWVDEWSVWLVTPEGKILRREHDSRAAPRPR